MENVPSLGGLVWNISHRSRSKSSHALSGGYPKRGVSLLSLQQCPSCASLLYAIETEYVVKIVMITTGLHEDEGVEV